MSGSTWAPFALKSLDDIVDHLEEPLSDSAVLPAVASVQRTSAYVKVRCPRRRVTRPWRLRALLLAGVADRLSHSAIGWSQAVGQVADLLPPERGRPNVMRRAGKLAHSVDLPESLRYVSWFEIFTGRPSNRACVREPRSPRRASRSCSSAPTIWPLDGVQKHAIRRLSHDAARQPAS